MNLLEIPTLLSKTSNSWKDIHISGYKQEQSFLVFSPDTLPLQSLIAAVSRTRVNKNRCVTVTKGGGGGEAELELQCESLCLLMWSSTGPQATQLPPHFTGFSPTINMSWDTNLIEVSYRMWTVPVVTLGGKRSASKVKPPLCWIPHLRSCSSH